MRKTKKKDQHRLFVCFGLLVVLIAGIAVNTSALTPHQDAINEAIESGCAYLESRQTQYDNSGIQYGYWYPGFSGANAAGTGMALLALISNWEQQTSPDPIVDNEYIRRGINYLLATQYPDGTWGGNVTYQVSAAVWGLAGVLGTLPAGSPSIAPIESAIAAAENWIIGSQWDESCWWGSVYPSNTQYYGGFGYGSHTRPDLSNSQFALVALKAALLDASSPSWAKGAMYVEQCQYKTHNDGGMWYTPDAPVWGYGSTGSMTAAGVWAYRLCGVPTADPRVQHALEWLGNYYTYTQNPNGYPSYSHYYYLWGAAKGFLVCDIKDEIGGTIPVDPADAGAFYAGWYHDFSKYLVGQQRADGSWLSGSYNGGLILDTEYALFILQKEVGIPYAVQVSIAPQSVAVDAGEVADFTVTVENIGTLQDSYDMGVIGLPAGFGWTMQNPVENVPAGTSEALPLAISTPANLAIWEDTPFPFIVEATSQSDPDISHATSGEVEILAQPTPISRIHYVDSLLTALMEAVEAAEIQIGVEAADDYSSVVESLLYHLYNAEREKHMALDKLEQGDTTTALNMLNATANMMVSFINAVEARRGVWVLDADADSFIAQAEDIIWRLGEIIDEEAVVLAKAGSGEVPGSFHLLQNYPNPFNPSTEISFSLPEGGHVRLEVYNILGQRVSTLIDEWYPAGVHTTTWDGGGAPTGVYLYRLTAGDIDVTKKMLLMK